MKKRGQDWKGVTTMKHRDYKIREKLLRMELREYKKKLLKHLKRSDNNGK